MNVREMIEWLKTQDQELTVQVLRAEHHGYGHCSVYEEDLDPGYNSDVVWNTCFEVLLLGANNGSDNDK
jgi:hypothetical protein